MDAAENAAQLFDHKREFFGTNYGLIVTIHIMELWLIVCDVLEPHIIMPFDTLERMQNRSYVIALLIHYLSILVVIISGVKSGKSGMLKKANGCTAVDGISDRDHVAELNIETYTVMCLTM